MRKKLTVTLDEKIYDGLHQIVGRGNIAHFIEDRLRPYVLKDALDTEYSTMAQDTENTQDAEVWSEASLNDLDSETW